MISALKLAPEMIRVADLKLQDSGHKSEFTIFLRDEIKSKLTVSNALETYSPRALIKNSALKKNAWNELQKVILHFNTVSN